MDGTRIWIAICTRDREAMLRVALASLAGVRLPEGYDVGVLVVENAAEAVLPARMADVTMPFPLVFRQEPVPGFSSVRNRAIEEALALGADWIVWFDDDQTAHPDWLVKMFAVVAMYPRDRIFTGRQRLLYDQDQPSILRRRADEAVFNGSDGRRGGTCNAAMHRTVFAADGLGMRFHPDFNLTGGEDTELFNRYWRHHGPIIWVEDAVVFERVVPERATIEYRVMREASVYWTMGHIAIRHRGPVEGRILCFRQIAERVFSLAWNAFLVAIAAGPRPNLARKRKVDMRFTHAQLRGYWAAMWGRKVSRYPAIARGKALLFGQDGGAPEKGG
jgi:glycosyltransferase involved in cell wall biosynthesis